MHAWSWFPEHARSDPKWLEQLRERALRQRARLLGLVDTAPLAPRPVIEIIQRGSELFAEHEVDSGSIEDGADVGQQRGDAGVE